MIIQSHTLLAKFLHWGFVILYSYGIIKQIDDLSQLEDQGLLIFEIIFAIAFLAIVIFRYLYMKNFETFLGAKIKIHKIHKIMARTTHMLIYLSLVLLPTSGLIIAGLYSFGVKDGIFQDIAIGIHEFSAAMSYILILIHIGSAVYSNLKGEGVWTSMVPVIKEKQMGNNQFIKKVNEGEKILLDKIENYFFSKDNTNK